MSAALAATAPGLVEVPLAALPPTRFAGTAEPDQYERYLAATEVARDLFRGRVIWNVNSTPQGGGVAEMLRPLLGCVRGAGVDARWAVIRGNPAFFRVTKRLHNRLHGEVGDGGELGAAERDAYAAVTEANAAHLVPRLHPADIVILHDPQTAGMIGAVKATGAKVVWRCHIGADRPDDLVRQGWAFLEPFVAEAHAYVFSRPAHVWECLDRSRVHVIPPSIDVLAPKNADLDQDAVTAVLRAAGLLRGHATLPPHFVRSDGSAGRVDRRASTAGGPLPEGAPLVAQVSRWDRLKDPLGVMEGFVDGVAPRTPEAHLALVGPEVVGVSDDPEGASVLAAVAEARHRLPVGLRRRVHLVSLPMADTDLNAVLVNALQRRAGVVVQKSLAEGFGLTVAEAMWKARPIVASRVGGIQDQIEDGVSGLLVEPADLVAYADATLRLLDEPAAAEAMGAAARERCRRFFLGPRHLLQYFELTLGL